jgi:rubrerythrin
MRLLRTIALSGLLSFSLCLPAGAAASPASAKYPETAAVMQAALTGELLAHARYLAFAKKARDEKYPSLALFATSLAASEAVHARNFMKVLSDLGAVADSSIPAFPVADTRSNLKYASTAEMDEIDTRYPQFIARLKAEAYAGAVDALDHAWQAEKQHRDMIAKLVAGTGLLFPLVVKTFEDSAFRYFVCQNCGSTLEFAKLPKEHCPICGAAAGKYKEVVSGISGG